MIAGIDEAGRGPVIGPMVIGLVLAKNDQLKRLRKLGVDDSKKLSIRKRTMLSQIIMENVEYYDTLVINPLEIDNYVFNENLTLTTLMEHGLKKIIHPVKSKITFLQIDKMGGKDFADRFKDDIKGKIICEEKGDAKYTSIGAASILAKVVRDRIIENIKKDVKKSDPNLPGLGSGYPSDPETKKFLREYFMKYNQFSDYVRKSWSTISNLKDILSQSNLDDF